MNLALAKAALILALPFAVEAQPTLIRLSKPVFVSSGEFTSVTSAVRLGSGNIAIADAADRSLWLVDGVSGKAQAIGRVGDGPAEYRNPQFVLPFKAGFLLVDGWLQRVSEYDANASFVRSTPFPRGLVGSSIDMTRSIDAAGNLYFVAPALGAQPRLLPAYSWRYPDGEVKAIDFVGALRGPKFASVASDAKEGGRAPGVVRRVPYSEWDAFLGLSDGTVFVARSETRTVEWFDRGGRKMRTAAFPGMAVSIPDSVKRAVRPVGLQQALDVVYPPFDGELSVRSVADRVWLRAIPDVRDSSEWYGFGKTGAPSQLLRLPRSMRIIAVAEPYMIVVRRDESELKRLELYRIPN
jgi:hypothetical protein